MARPRVSARNSASPEIVASVNAMPEVLVPRDQEVLLARYEQEWGSRKRAPLVAKTADETSAAPLEVTPIQIAELDVKPLAEGDSR